jgi:hypothetical protein
VSLSARAVVPDGLAIDMPTDQYMWGARFRLTLTPEAAEGLMAGYTDIETWYMHMLRNWSAHYQSYGKSSGPRSTRPCGGLPTRGPIRDGRQRRNLLGARRQIRGGARAAVHRGRAGSDRGRETRHPLSRHAGAATRRRRAGRTHGSAGDDNRRIAGQSLTGKEAHMEKIVDNLLGQFEHGGFAPAAGAMLALGMTPQPPRRAIAATARRASRRSR